MPANIITSLFDPFKTNNVDVIVRAEEAVTRFANGSKKQISNPLDFYIALEYEIVLEKVFFLYHHSNYYLSNHFG